MKFSYSAFVERTDKYLKQKREQSRLWRALLPAGIFSPELWLRNPKAISIGAALGVFWALAPVPMQSLFALLSALRFHANIPIAFASCWISFPGYQLILWPLQWWVGHEILTSMHCGSGLSAETVKKAAHLAMDGQTEAIYPLLGAELPLATAELLLGCLVTCSSASLAVGYVLYFIFSRRPATP